MENQVVELAQAPFPTAQYLSQFLRLPVILGVEALISGRILHESCPAWFHGFLAFIFIIPLFLPDRKLPLYYQVVLVYFAHSLLNLVDSFLLNLPRPETRPIWGLIGQTAMELADFQYLVRIGFMLFNLILFRGIVANILVSETEKLWSRVSLLSYGVSVWLIFGNFEKIGSCILFGMRMMVLKNIVVPIFQEIEELSKNQWLREELRVRRAENPGLPGLLSVLVKLGWDQIVRVNPSLTTLLEILFKSMIIKGVFHSLATLMQLSIKVEPLTSLAPSIEDISVGSINSTGIAILNMSAFALDEFAKMSYFDGFTTKSLFSSVVLISTDSLLSVFAIAYFLNAPGEWLGVFIQRWLVNGQEPHDPHERGARMGQFLSMLHGFMALQTGITYMEPACRLDRAEKNTWLVVVACLHYLHEMVDAELTNNPDVRSVNRPMKAMILLFLSALLIEYQLITYHEVSTWWIPVFVFTLELIIKTSTSFIVYFMLKYDCNEDWIFWIKTGSKFCELIGGCIMLGNAIYVLIYQKPIMVYIRVIMMLIHTYFNIYRTFTKMWGKIRLRILTGKKLDSLKTVNVEEIPEPDRLCAICYEDFVVGCTSNPVIETECQHRFHKLCIKKWLRLKNVCPLCHRPVFKSETPPADTENENQQDPNQNIFAEFDFDEGLDELDF